MKTQKEIIEETLKEFVEKHELNLKNIGGWDKNDFLDYSRQLLEKVLQFKQKDVLKIIKEEIETPTYEGSIKELQYLKKMLEQNDK